MKRSVRMISALAITSTLGLSNIQSASAFASDNEGGGGVVATSSSTLENIYNTPIVEKATIAAANTATSTPTFLGGVQAAIKDNGGPSSAITVAAGAVRYYVPRAFAVLALLRSGFFG